MAQATSNLIKPSPTLLSDTLKKFQGPNPFAPFMKSTPTIGLPSLSSSSLFGQTPANTGYSSNGYPMSVAPAGATKPTAKAAPAKTTATNTGTGSPGLYKNVAINPGTTQQIQAQMREIDGNSNTKVTAKPTGSLLNLPKGSTVAAPAPQQQATQTFPGLVSGITSASNPSNTQTGLVKTVTDTAAGNRAFSEDANRIAQKYGGEIARIGALGAGAVAGAKSTGTNVVGSGNAAIASQSASQRMQALSDAGTFELEGIDRQLTAQQQMAAAQQAALAASNTQQAQTITGLGKAGELAAPEVAGFGQTAFNPLQGGFGAGGDAQFNQSIEQYAQLAANNQMGAIPSFITGNPVLNAQVLQRAQQLNPAFNFNTAAGTGAAEQTGATIAGTTVPQANQQIYGQALGDYYTMSSMLQNVDQLGGLLLNTASGGQINPFSPQLANQTLAKLRTQLSDEDQVRFNSALATFQASAQSLLANSNAITPTDLGNAIQGIANGSLSLGALKALVDQAKREGSIRLQNQANIVNQSRSGTLQGGGSSGTSTGGGAGGSVGWF